MEIADNPKPTPAEQFAAIEELIADMARRVFYESRSDLDRLDRLGELVDQATADAVTWMRAEGVTWETIGRYAGMTKQGAIRRWNKRIDPHES
ncbi:MAG: hypothetical protein J2P58_01825 [Acidimicrobiaceae bacterium]|nr:hypothetical protein [Acidimicrobiaceae bacterium]